MNICWWRIIFLLNMAMFGLCAWSLSLLRGDDLMILLIPSPIPN